MMDFKTMYNIAPVGSQISVTNSQPEPPKDLIRVWGRWRRENFSGTIVEKAGDRIAVSVQEGNNVLVFVINENSHCNFSILQPDIEVAEKVAIQQIEQTANTKALQEMPRLWRQIVTMTIWNEIQRLKLANATGNYTNLEAIERQKQFPCLAALAAESGLSIPNVATSAENKLINTVRRIVTAQAKLLIGEDTVRAATTVEDKLAAAAAIDWSTT